MGVRKRIYIMPKKTKEHISPCERAKDPEVRRRIDAKVREYLSPDQVLVEYLAKHGINASANIKHMKKHIEDYNLVFDIIKTVRDYEAKKAAERGEILMYDNEHDLFHNKKTGETFTVEDIAIGEKLKK